MDGPAGAGSPGSCPDGHRSGASLHSGRPSGSCEEGLFSEITQVMTKRKNTWFLSMHVSTHHVVLSDHKCQFEPQVSQVGNSVDAALPKNNRECDKDLPGPPRKATMAKSTS